VPSVLFHVVESTDVPLTVTAEVASSSLVVPAIFSNHLQALPLTDQGIASSCSQSCIQEHEKLVAELELGQN
jgi:hypothetical protein